jgi:putative transposase
MRVQRDSDSGGECGDGSYPSLCIAIPPKHSVASIVGYLKGKSTMIVCERYGKRKRHFRGHSFWARGYYVSTVGRDEEQVRQYIRNQETNETIEEKYEPPEDDNLFSRCS